MSPDRTNGVRVLVDQLPEPGPISPGHQFDWSKKYPFNGSMRYVWEIYESLSLIPHPEPKEPNKKGKK